MILHASAAFVKRFKCDVSFPDRRLTQDRTRMDSWNCHFVRLGTTPVVVVMHDTTLFTYVIPAKGMKTFVDFWMCLVSRIAGTWWKYLADFDPNNQGVIVVPRTDRSRIGSMNDAIQVFRIHHSRGDNLDDLERRSNHTPYKAIGYDIPEDLLRKMLS